jgi:hypothetical protein
MLPFPHLPIGRETVFHEEQLSTWAKDSAHLRERSGNIRDGAQGPGCHSDTSDCRPFDERPANLDAMLIGRMATWYGSATPAIETSVRKGLISRTG